MITKTKTIALLFISVFFLIGNQTAEAQLLKKLKDAADGKSSGSTEKKGSKIKGEDLINKNFTEDEYGVSGIYYYQNESGIFPAKFDLSICDKMSTFKGAENVPECIGIDFSIAHEERGNLKEWKGLEYSEYIYAANLLTHKELFYHGNRTLDPLFQIEKGVLFMAPNNMYSSFSGEDAPINKLSDEMWNYMFEKGTFYVKNKEDLAKWNKPDITLVKSKILAHVKNIQTCYAEIDAKKNAKNEMPSIGKLNSKFIQDRALKTYKEKYDPINAGWTHHYMYVHGNEWINKKAYNAYGALVDTHRELQVVIVRTSPKGECRADLMYYVELYANGTYDAANGKVTGPVSFIGMPGGVLPCEKTTAFKSKLAK